MKSWRFTGREIFLQLSALHSKVVLTQPSEHFSAMSVPTQQANSSPNSGQSKVEPLPTGIPFYRHWTRYTNIILTLILFFMVWIFFLLTTVFGVMGASKLKMPLIYFCTFAVGLAATLFSLGGSGHRVYMWSLVGGLITLVAAIILFNTQVYLYTISKNG